MAIIFFIFSQVVIPDFQVNTEDYPGNAPQSYPAITTNDSGGVIIWYDLRQPSHGMMVLGSLIDIAGDTINNNFLLNDDTTTGCMSIPQIAGDINGNFTIVYVQHQNIKARRFNRYGIPFGPSFVVSINSNCAYPAIKIRGNRTIITWFQGGANRIYGQIYDNSGNPIDTNFVVSDSSVAYNTISDIAIRNNGNFIVAWHFNNEIWAQKFDSLGNRISGNYKLINDSISASESNPKIEFDDEDNLFITWNASVQGQGDINCQILDSALVPLTNIIRIDGPDKDSAQRQAITIKDSIYYVVFQNGINGGIYLQLINKNGELIGDNIRINEQVGRRNNLPKVSATANNLIITWSRNLIGMMCDIICQKVAFNGNLIDSNYTITDDKGGEAQMLPSVTSDNNGNFFIVWQDYRRFPNDYDVPNIYCQLYDSYGNPITQEFRVNIHSVAEYPDICLNSSIYLAIWARTLSDTNHQIYAQRFDLNGNPVDTNYQVSASSNNYQISFPKLTRLSNENFVAVWTEYDGTKEKIFGRILDGNGLPIGNQFQVYIDSLTDNYAWKAVDEGNGRFIIPISCSIDTFAAAIQEFDYNGSPISTPIILNDSSAPIFFVSGAKGIDRYLFVWVNNGPRLIGQFLDINLQKIGNNVIISDSITPYINYYSVVSNNEGRFFVIWDDWRNSNPDLYGQFFDSSANKIGTNFRVDNDTMNSEQSYPNCFSANNLIYITWNDNRIPSHWFDIYCKVIGWGTYPKIEEQEVQNLQSFLKVCPNPFRNRTIIRYMIQDTGYKIQDSRYKIQDIILKIYDVSGRLVKSFNLDSCIMNRESAILWFGEDDSGRRLPSGVYFIRLEDGGFRKTEKAILLR